MKYFLIILICFSLLFSWLPSNNRNDINQDNSTDLKDAIIHITNLANTVENTGNFSQSLSKSIFALQRAAGLRTVIKRTSNDNSEFSLNIDQYLPFINLGIFVEYQISYVFNNDINHKEHVTQLIIPPPQFIS